MTLEYYQPTGQIQIEISDSAKNRLIKVIQTTAGGYAMRLSVKKSGCSGYAYDLQCVTELYSEDVKIELGQGFQLFIDSQFLFLLNGLKLDYVKEGLQHKFIYDNPNQSGQCGCGESFSVS